MFFLIDKPIGMSSFDVIRKLRKILGTKKMGFVGTLDPLASGCLLVATDKSTKLIPLLEKSEKTYLFSVDISGKTPSLDMGTSVEESSLENILPRSSAELRDFLLSQQLQIPPAYSAIHVDGERAYSLARENKDFVLPSRNISVSNVEIIEFIPPIFTIRLRISSGGYIRSFAPLIGKFFGVGGGYVTMLRREILHLPSGDLDIRDSQSIESFTSERHLPYDQLFRNLPLEEISTEVYQDLVHGKEIVSIDEGYKNGQNILLRYENIFTSLVTFHDNRFLIVKNDV